MAGMLEYKCPCCDGAIQFDSATQKMKCPYCDTEFDVDTLKGYDEELKDEKPSEMEWATPGGSWAEGETAGLHTYSCKSCGGEIVGDDTMAASACPFCGNPIVLTGQFAGALRPDLIIPFKLDKKAAKAKLQEHLKGKTLLPRVFRSQNHIDEIKGVYAHRAGCRVGARYRQPQCRKIHPVLCRRIPPFAERGADRRLFRGDLEAFSQVGRHPHSPNAERQRSAGKP